MRTRDSVAVVGSGPNGLAAAVTLARAGLDVTVFERDELPGGGARTVELMETGVWHDLCSAVHPMAVASPFFQRFQLQRRIQLVTPEVSFAEASERGVVLASRDLSTIDGAPSWYVRTMRRMSSHIGDANALTLGGPRLPGTAGELMAVIALGSSIVDSAARARVRPGDIGLLAGVIAHAAGVPWGLAANGVAVMLAANAHVGGWPVPRGGSGAITRALLADLAAHGGRVVAGHDVTSFAELDGFGARILNLAPSGVLALDDGRLPVGYRRALQRFRSGPGVQKLDLVVSAPIPWTDPRLRTTPTVHIGSPRQVADAAVAVRAGRHPDRPFVLLVQADLFDPSRTVPGRHTVWAYSHVPNGSNVDRSEVILDEIERLAPGFRDTITGRLTRTASAMGTEHSNYPGGDILSGAVSMRQTVSRPILAANPWRIPVFRTYLSSAATFPGPGVHGMAGYRAALLLLRELRLPEPDLSMR